MRKDMNRILATTLTLCIGSIALNAQSPELVAQMTKGKLEHDLGHYATAADAFAAVANDGSVPIALRSEALVRLGLARSAAGDTRASLAAFNTVLTRYPTDRHAVRFATGALATAVPGKIWADFSSQLEELLRTGEILSAVDVKMTTPSSKIVRLKWDDFEVKTVWRANELGRERATSPSRSRELAAYEVDKMLALGMIPPTVPRAIDGQSGAIQFWVNGVRVYEHTQAMPKNHEWGRQLSRMKLFDALLGNTGRVLGNMIVDRNDNLLLIDFMEAFSSDRTLTDPPVQFDRRLVEKLRRLDAPEARSRLRTVLTDDTIESMLARRDALLAHLAKLIAERGEAAVVF